mgnify:CR=1 FL=1
MDSFRDAFNRTAKGNALVAMADRHALKIKEIENNKRIKARTAILKSLARKMFVKIGHDDNAYSEAQENIAILGRYAPYKIYKQAKYAIDGMYETPVSRKEARQNALASLEKYVLQIS